MSIKRAISILVFIASQCHCFQGIIYRAPILRTTDHTRGFETRKNSETKTIPCLFYFRILCQGSASMACFVGRDCEPCLSGRRYSSMSRSVIRGFSQDNDYFVSDSSTDGQVRSLSTSSTVLPTSIEFNSINSGNQGYSMCQYHTISIPTSYTGLPNQSIIVEDLTPVVNRMIQQCGIKNGLVTICSRHTTTSITINEYESRLIKDIENVFLTKLMPPDRRSISSYSQQSNITYYHNDIHLRPETDVETQRCFDNGWNITDPNILQEWRDQEPINAHSHLLSMLIGSTESIPIQDSKMVLGQWQSILLIDFDGPRNRTVGIQFMGFR